MAVESVSRRSMGEVAKQGGSRSGENTDIPVLAAAYAFGLVRNDPYRDGNKRIGFLAVVTFLGINGYAFDAPDADVVTQFVALAAGDVSADHLADWIRFHSRRSRR